MASANDRKGSFCICVFYMSPTNWLVSIPPEHDLFLPWRFSTGGCNKDSFLDSMYYHNDSQCLYIFKTCSHHFIMYHLVMTNIAMENPQNNWRFLAGKIIYKWAIYTMAMLNNQRVSKQHEQKPWLQMVGFLKQRTFSETIFPSMSGLQLFPTMMRNTSHTVKHLDN